MRPGNRFFLVGANRSLPGRDKREDADAIGRSLEISFLEQACMLPEGLLLRPCNNEGTLELVNMTIAEISQASGYHPATSHRDTTRDVEIKHESCFLSHDIVVYDAARYDGDSWQFLASNPRPLEQNFLEIPLEQLTKCGLARRLQLQEGLSDAQRSELYSLTKLALLERLAH